MTIGMKKLSSKTLKKVYNRHYQLLGCFNYERQMSTGYAWTMMPAIRELYGEDEAKMKAGVKRHLEFFNCATTPSPFIIGITCAMEEQCASAPDGEFDVASINSVKAALMGPLAGIGDSFFWGTFRVIGVGVGAPLAVAGNILGPILYFLINFIPSEIVRRVGFKIGYEGGSEFLTRISEDGTLNKLTEAARIMGLVVIGAMMASMVNVNLVTVLPELLTSPKLTADWEQRLNEVAKGQASPQDFMDGIEAMAAELVRKYSHISEDGQKLFQPEKETVGLCPRCGKPVYEGKKNFACSDRACQFVMWKNDRFWTSRRKEMTRKMAADLLKKGRTSVKGMWSEKKGSTYDAVVILDDTGGKYVNFKLEFPKRKDGVHGKK